MICRWPVSYLESDKKIAISRYRTGYGMNVHTHYNFEIEYVLSGSYHQNFKNESHECSRGCITLFKPDSRHEFAASSEVEIFKIQIRPNLMPQIYNTYAQEFSSTTVIHIPPYEIRRIESILFAIEKEFNMQNEFFLEVISGYLDILMTLLIRINRINANENKRNTAIDFEAVLSYIENNLKNVTPKSVAGFSGYNFPYFSKSFKKNIGRNLSEYINLRRLETAQNLLVESNKSIENIGYEVGFNHKSYFHRVFKRYYGVTPEEYRNSNIINKKRTK